MQSWCSVNQWFGKLACESVSHAAKAPLKVLSDFSLTFSQTLTQSKCQLYAHTTGAIGEGYSQLIEFYDIKQLKYFFTKWT